MLEEITKLINDKRPTLSASSVKTYVSILSNLYKKVFGDEYQSKNFDDSEKILKHLSDMPVNKRKTILSALVVITSCKAYRDQMLKDIENFNEDIGKQEKTESQEESWVSNNNVQDLHNSLMSQSMALYRKTSHSMTDLQEIQNFIILCLLGGIYIPPRRSKDYVDFKISNIDHEKDNYIEKKKFIFNSYKTAKTYGRASIECPPELMKIIKKWVKINPTEYLLFDSQGNKLSNVKLNQRINKIFGKKVSVNQLRHTYLTSKYSDLIEKENALDADMKQMGSSRGQFKTYVKKE